MENITIATVTRTNKGKGVTVTCVRGNETRDFVMRKTGGEKYGKIALYAYSPEQWERVPEKGNRWPLSLTIHKPTTKVISHKYLRLVQVVEF